MASISSGCMFPLRLLWGASQTTPQITEDAPHIFHGMGNSIPEGYCEICSK